MTPQLPTQAGDLDLDPCLVCAPEPGTTPFPTAARQCTLSCMRIGEPARKHGITDADIEHAARYALRRVVLDEDLTMLLGPARDGHLLEVGVLDLHGDDPAAIHAMPLRAKFARLL